MPRKGFRFRKIYMAYYETPLKEKPCSRTKRSR